MATIADNRESITMGDTILSPTGQATTYGLAIFGYAAADVAAVVSVVAALGAVILCALQIGLLIERRWFSKRRNRRSKDS